MSSTLTLRNGQQEYQLCRDLADCESTGARSPAAMALQDPISALYFLREVITDSGQQHELRLWLLDHSSSFEMYSIDDDSVLDCVAKMIASGQLVVAGAGAGAGAGEEGEASTSTEGIIRKGSKSVLVSHVDTTPLQDEMASKDAAATEAAAEDEAGAADETAAATTEAPGETTWIEIELLDPNGNPVPNERYKITMPDGSIKYGRLDENAKARIEKLQPGSCQVTFPDRDQEVWDVG